MEATKKAKEITELFIQVLGTISIIVLMFFLGMIIGVLWGAISVKDVSAFSDWARFLYYHPAILAIAAVFAAWSVKIWIKDEKPEKHSRPVRWTGKLSIQKPQRS